MRERMSRWIKSLELTKDERKQIKLVLVVATGLGLILLLVDNQRLGESLSRNTYGGGNRVETLQVEIQEGGEPREFDISISEREYNKEQITQLKDEAWDCVVMILQKGQESLECVAGFISLPEKVEGYPFDIKWSWNPKELLNSKGEIQEDKLSKDGALVLLEGVLSYREYEFIFQQGIYVVHEEVTAEESV